MTIQGGYYPDMLGKLCVIQNVFIHGRMVIPLGLCNFGCDTDNRKIVEMKKYIISVLAVLMCFAGGFQKISW